MSLWRQLSHGARVLFRRADADQELGDEVRHYIDESTAAHIARGMSPADAARSARLEVGNATVVREEVRSHGWESTISSIAADLRYAGRMLRKSPVFTVVVVSVIAIGTGAVTTVFSAMNTLLFRPMPGTSGDTPLVMISRRDPAGTSMSGSYPYVEHLRTRTRTLAGIAGLTKVSLNIQAGDNAIPAYGEMVTDNYFSLLGARPAVGRFFLPEEGRSPMTHPVVVLSHAFWQRWFAGDPAILGRTITVNGHPYTVIGVSSPEFRGVSAPIVSDAWVPVMMLNQLRPELNWRITDAGFAGLRMFGRLADGATVEAAQAELTALTAALVTERSEPARHTGFDRVQLRPMMGLNLDDDRGMVTGFLALLLGASGLVLLIASVNIASMLSARAVVRRRELAVRAALGAGRGRLVRQVLTEILVLFSLGAIGGVALAVLSTGAVERMSIPLELSIALELSPDLRVMLFALFVSLATGLAFGLPPALNAVRIDITTRLRDGAAGSGVRRSRFTNFLIVSQLAAALVLLVAAGLFMRALSHGTRADPGFDATNVGTYTFFSESWGYDRARTTAFFHSLREHVAGLPGVIAVSYTTHLPLTLHNSGDNIQLEGVGAPGSSPAAGVPVWYEPVDAGYLELLGIPLRAGRSFTPADVEGAPRVAVVNETFARRYFPDGSAIGRSFVLYRARYTIVGIARDAKYSNLTESPTPFVYFSANQMWNARRTLVVRTSGDPAVVAPAIHAAIREIDPGVPRVPMVTLRDANSIVLFPQRVAAIVTGALGAIGLLLASVGLYGIIAYSVTRRTREIGIRLALGARATGVVGLIVREGMALACIGVVLGLLLAAGATRLIARFLFSVSPLDVATFGGMSMLFVAVALVASWLPARRAAASDPMVVLRGE